MLRASLIAFLLTASPAFAESARISDECMGNAVESCFIIIDGKITPETLTEFKVGLADRMDGFKVLLNSDGGSFKTGLALGRFIREQGLHTEVGRVAYAASGLNSGAFERFDSIEDGQCVSACAYAFLGGVVRKIYGESRLGFHRFYLAQGDLPGEGGLAAGQLVAADVISYLIEMGVDARIFVTASSAGETAMNYPTPDELKEFDLVTPTGFSPFTIEPYQQGIIAVSRRLDQTRAYDHAYQLTAYCRNGQPHFLMTADHPGVGDEGQGAEDAVVELDGRRIPVSGFSLRNDDANSYFTFQMAQSDVPSILSAQHLSVMYMLPRVAGGPQDAEIETTETDHEMLSAAFRFCF